MADITRISTAKAQRVDYELRQGMTWEPGTITCDIAGTPINFTGYTASMEIRNRQSNTAALTLATGGNGITMSSAGVITITATAAQTLALEATEYEYELIVTYPNAKVFTFIEGVITVVPKKTQV